MLTHEQKIELEQNIILLEKKVASLKFSLKIQQIQLPRITAKYQQARASIQTKLASLCFIIDRSHDALDQNRTLEEATHGYNEDAWLFQQNKY